MHLADGIVTDPLLIGGATVLAAGVVTAAMRVAAKEEARLAWTGTLAAFVFVAQAINVPLVPGASAHVIGASLLTLATGPARAIVAMTAVLLAQALLLADGGVSVIGVNVLTLAVAPVAVLTCVRACLSRVNARTLTFTTVAGTALGSAVGASLLGFILVVGAGAPARATFAWLVGVQALAGLVEGGLTAAAVGRLRHIEPALLAGGAAARGDATRASNGIVGRAIAWTAVAVVLALCLVPFASETPDALEQLLHELRADR